jgi:UDP-N-acetylglucosamine/UDP-N-acetylgalactosamine diphosphorylase
MRFLETAAEWATTLPHHIAKKKIPYVDLKTGQKIKPDKPNGIKMEQFVFDVFDLIQLDKFGVFEVDRKEEFSPLKNGKGSNEDNPETSRRDVLLQGRRWVEAAGGSVLDDGDKDAGIEISPLVCSPRLLTLMIIGWWVLTLGFVWGGGTGVYGGEGG